MGRSLFFLWDTPYVRFWTWLFFDDVGRLVDAGWHRHRVYVPDRSFKDYGRIDNRPVTKNETYLLWLWISA
jgi:hypothetical protein